MSLPRLFASLLLLALASLLRAETYTWSNVPIHGGGFVSGLLYHPKTEGLLYSRTDVGGAFRWNPTQGVWIPLNDDIGRDDSQLTGVVSFAVDANDDQRLYLATGQYLPFWARTAALLRSTNRGSTWTKIELPFKLGGNSDGRSAGERLQVDPNLGRILFLGTNENGLYRSADWGDTWTKVTGFSGTAVTCVAFDAGTSTTGTATPRLYAATTGKAGDSLYVSTDGGTTWSLVPGQPSGLHVYRATVDADGTLYATWTDGLGPNGVATGAIWRRTRAGVWTNITPPTGQGGFAGISVCPAQPGVLIASTLDRWSPGDVVYRSSNSGTAWTATLARSQLDHSETPWAAASSPHWIGDVQVNPFNANEAWFVTGYGVYSTSNLQAASGTSVLWSFRNRGLEETVPLALVSPLSGAHLLSAVGDLDGWRHDSLDTPAATRLQPSVGTNRSIDLAGTQDQIAARLSDSTGYYSLDQGVTWTVFAAKPTFSSDTGKIAVNADGTTILWTPKNSVPYRSTNRGSSWTAATGLPSAASAEWTVVTDRVNKDRCALYNRANGSVYTSSDAGATWTLGATGLPSESSSMKAVFGKEGHLWLTIYNGGLYRSTDGGKTFSKISVTSSGYLVGVGKAASVGGYPAVYLDGTVSGQKGIFRSDDEGATWVRVNDDQHRFGWINDLTGDPKVYGRVYLATGGRGIVRGELNSLAAPTITQHPTTRTQAAGSTLTLTVAATGEAPLSYQWSKDGQTINGATSSTLTLNPLQAGDAGRYTCAVTNGGGTTVSRQARVIVETPTPSRIINLSVRTQTGQGGSPLIVGFVLYGGAKDMLLRGIGPSLGAFGITSFLPDPKITVFDGGSQVLATNDDWGAAGAAPALRTLFPIVGAFALSPDSSKDAAKLITATNQHTVHIQAASGSTQGTVLMELYDAGSGTAQRLRNISARNYAGSGEQTLIAGFAIDGTEPKQILIRAVGPTLTTTFGIPNSLSDPSLELLEYVDNRFVTVARNDNWGSEPGAGDAFTPAGAFALPVGSKDSALLVTLANGVYSAVIDRTAGNYGEAIVEVYEVIP